MKSQSADEAKAANIAKMGEPLGEMYSALWQSVAIVHVYWKEYVELFGTKPERITLLNDVAPTFFHMLQDELWDSSLLHLCRLTDPAVSPGKQTNLTVQALPALISDTKLEEDVAGTDEAGHAFQFEAGRVFRSEAGHPWRQSHGSI